MQEMKGGSLSSLQLALEDSTTHADVYSRYFPFPFISSVIVYQQSPSPSQVIFQLDNIEVSNVCFYFLDLSLVSFKQRLFQNFLDWNKFNASLVPDAGDKLETGLHPYGLLGMSLLWKPLGGNDK